MSSRNQLLRMFDDAWDHRDESVHAALKGITPEEAKWQHPAYAAGTPEHGMPPPGTVLWQIAHLAHSAAHYTCILRDRPVREEPRTPPPAGSTLSALRTQMERHHAALRSEIAALSDRDLRPVCAREMTVEAFLRMAIRHDSWHAGQIVVIRRLYRHHGTKR